MKYNAKEFLNDLKEADKKKIASKRRKNKKAYSRRDVADTADDLLVVAENLGEFYEKKDAQGAINNAKKQWLRDRQGDMFSMLKEASKLALKDLLDSWKSEGHI